MSFDDPHAAVGDDAGRAPPDKLTPAHARALSRSAPLAPRYRRAEQEPSPDDRGEGPAVPGPQERRSA